MYISHCGYLREVFQPDKLEITSKRVARKIRNLQKKLKFDAIAFRGASGAGIAYCVSMPTGIPLIYVRKEKSHGNDIEGPGHDVRSYIILDDFIDTGKTIKVILNKLSKPRPTAVDMPECVGICLYSGFRECTEFTYRKKEIPVMDV